jgi:hypothetical protein
LRNDWRRLNPRGGKETRLHFKDAHRGNAMRKSKSLGAPCVGKGLLQPARAADAKLDHLERMIRVFVNQGACPPPLRLDHAYWRDRVSLLAEECDLVVTQRARVIRLMDLLDGAERKMTQTTQAAA